MSGVAGRLLLAGALAIAVATSSGCALRFAPPPGSQAAALRVSEVAGEGDATRRASLRLVLQGLDEDANGRAATARSSYERAIQIDATNPYAYLALARHEVEAERYRRALEALDQAELLFGSEPAPGVDAHLAGLRGAARLGTGYGGDAEVLLDQAARAAPEVWADGHLGAGELR
jgi:tetratricopeptide (TPR) repeat protein